MGLFSFNYAKPGPGVSKDAPKKKGVFLYFELLGRKFFKLMQVSWLYCLTSIPYIVAMFFFVTTFFGGHIQQIFSAGVDGGVFNPEDVNLIIFIISALLTMVFLVLWGSGPASAGLAYVTRCFTREEHSWILSDFFGKIKENFKQSIIFVVIDFVVLFFMSNAIIQYWNLYTAKNQLVWLMLLYVCILAFVIYTFMHYNIYQIMVTYDCKFKDLLKNSLLLALGKAPVNLILTIIPIAVLYLLFNYLQPVPAVMVVLVLLFGFLRYPFEFNGARTIQKILNTSTEGK